MAPCACHPLGSSTMGSRAFALTYGVLATLPHRTAEYCVRYSRAGGMKCGTATPSCSDAWTQESSRLHSHLPEPRPCALGSSRIHSHLHEARKASIALLGHRGYTRISPDLCECPPLAFSLHCDPSQFRHFPKKGCMASVSPGTPRMKKKRTVHVPVPFAPFISHVS